MKDNCTSGETTKYGEHFQFSLHFWNYIALETHNSAQLEICFRLISQATDIG
jgi:hypothetical protein